MRRVRPDAVFLRALLASTVVALAPLSLRAEGPFKHDYFAGNHRLDSALPNEHVDPLSGNLLVTATDLVLPGNAGLDLAVTRIYSSQIFPDFEDSGSAAFYGEFLAYSAIGGAGGAAASVAWAQRAEIIAAAMGRQSFLFGTRGYLNSGRLFRIGHSRDGGEGVFRMAGTLVEGAVQRLPLLQRIATADGRHIIIRRLGPL